MSQLDRRAFLRIGSIAPVGLLPWGGALGARLRPDREVSIIQVRLEGGLSHIDTFDMKPGGDRRFRGAFQAIPTNVDGLRICEHLPLTARQADKYTVIRSMTHNAYSHEGARSLMWTGQPLTASGPAPSIGAVVSKAFGPRNEIPAHVSIRAGVMDLPRSARAARALDVTAEAAALREKYGRTAIGQGCLQARRLVEAGARLVTVSSGGWDHHRDIFKQLANDALPAFDHAFATLLEDLQQRGLLDSTIVLAGGEFGRSPAINAYQGRDHWPNCFSMVIAGGGIAGGRVWGSTDENAMAVRDSPVEVPDLLATLYQKLGIDPTQEHGNTKLSTAKLSTGRPLPFL
jgi:Protein of unknown function (DUF1501)